MHPARSSKPAFAFSLCDLMASSKCLFRNAMPLTITLVVPLYIARPQTPTKASLGSLNPRIASLRPIRPQLGSLLEEAGLWLSASHFEVCVFVDWQAGRAGFTHNITIIYGKRTSTGESNTYSAMAISTCHSNALFRFYQRALLASTRALALALRAAPLACMAFSQISASLRASCSYSTGL